MILVEKRQVKVKQCRYNEKSHLADGGDFSGYGFIRLYLFPLKFRFFCFPILDFNATNSAEVVYVVSDQYHLVL